MVAFGVAGVVGVGDACPDVGVACIDGGRVGVVVGAGQYEGLFMFAVTVELVPMLLTLS